eukprot:1358381-Rhodomonas_salina.1
MEVARLFSVAALTGRARDPRHAAPGESRRVHGRGWAEGQPACRLPPFMEVLVLFMEADAAVYASRAAIYGCDAAVNGGGCCCLWRRRLLFMEADAAIYGGECCCLWRRMLLFMARTLLLRIFASSCLLERSCSCSGLPGQSITAINSSIRLHKQQHPPP